MLITERMKWALLKSIAKAEKLNLSHKKDFDEAMIMYKKLAIQNNFKYEC